MFLYKQTKSLTLPYEIMEKGISYNRKVVKRGKTGSQQVLGKDGEKYTATRSHGTGLVMTLPKEFDGPYAFLTSTGKESDTCGLKKVRLNVKRSIFVFV